MGTEATTGPVIVATETQPGVTGEASGPTVALPGDTPAPVATVDPGASTATVNAERDRFAELRHRPDNG